MAEKVAKRCIGDTCYTETFIQDYFQGKDPRTISDDDWNRGSLHWELCNALQKQSQCEREEDCRVELVEEVIICINKDPRCITISCDAFLPEELSKAIWKPTAEPLLLYNEIKQTLEVELRCALEKYKIKMGNCADSCPLPSPTYTPPAQFGGPPPAKQTTPQQYGTTTKPICPPPPPKERKTQSNKKCKCGAVEDEECEKDYTSSCGLLHGICEMLQTTNTCCKLEAVKAELEADVRAALIRDPRNREIPLEASLTVVEELKMAIVQQSIQVHSLFKQIQDAVEGDLRNAFTRAQTKMKRCAISFCPEPKEQKKTKPFNLGICLPKEYESDCVDCPCGQSGQTDCKKGKNDESQGSSNEGSSSSQQSRSNQDSPPQNQQNHQPPPQQNNQPPPQQNNQPPPQQNNQPPPQQNPYQNPPQQNFNQNPQQQQNFNQNPQQQQRPPNNFQNSR